MIDFSDRTMENLLQEQLQRVTNSLDKREGSMIYTALAPESWELEGLYLLMNQMQQNAWVETAVGQYLDYKVAERGLIRNPATPAKREGVFNVLVEEGFRCSTINAAASLTYYAEADAELQDDGYYHATLICETPGVVGNEYFGNLLPITYVAGLTSAEMTTILLAGTDEESDEALRARYLLSLKEQPFAGNISAYRQTILDIDDVGAVQIYPTWDGGGTVKCVILDASYKRATKGTPDSLVTKVQNIICPPESGQSSPSANGYGFAPIGAEVTIDTGTDKAIALGTTITLQAGYDVNTITASIIQVYENYLLELRKKFGTPMPGTFTDYVIYCYISQINAAILSIEGVLNVTGTTLNGFASDLLLTEDAETQDIPINGGVSVYVAS